MTRRHSNLLERRRFCYSTGDSAWVNSEGDALRVLLREGRTELGVLYGRVYYLRSSFF